MAEKTKNTRNMLSEEECAVLERALTEDVEPRKAAAYLCLHMGLSVTEACALRLEDIELDSHIVNVKNCIGRPEGAPEGAPADFRPADMPRTLPMPHHVVSYLQGCLSMYPTPDCFIVTGHTDIPGTYHMQNMLNIVNNKYKITGQLSTKLLRNAFVRRSLQSGIDMYSLCVFIGIRQPNMIVNKFGEYLTPRLEDFGRLEKFSIGYKASPNACNPTELEPKRMNLLILGAGSQGSVVGEIAEAIGIFNEIAYLDDDPRSKRALGVCDSYQSYLERFPIAIPTFGNCQARAEWADRLEKAGFILPVLAHPMATVSPSAHLSEGVVVEAKAIVSAGARVERNCIVSAAAVLDKECSIGANSHIGCSSTITSGSRVKEFSQIPAGMVYKS